MSSVQIGSDPELLSSGMIGMNEDGARLFCFNVITRVMHRPGDVMENLPELGSLEWWISGLMHDPLFLLISRLT